MIEVEALDRVARARVVDAATLHVAERYDGAIYLAGYAVELALKASVCREHGLNGFPQTHAERKRTPRIPGLPSLWTHDLQALLRASGKRDDVTEQARSEWSQATQWTPDLRYSPVGTTSRTASLDMLRDVMTLLDVLAPRPTTLLPLLPPAFREAIQAEGDDDEDGRSAEAPGSGQDAG